MVRTKELIKIRESCTHRTITCGLCEAFSELIKVLCEETRELTHDF